MHIRANSSLRKRELPRLVKPYMVKVKGKKAVPIDSLRVARETARLLCGEVGWENVTLTNKKGTVLPMK